MGALSGLVYLMSSCVDVPSCQNLCGRIIQPTVTTLIMVMVGWEDDAFHSQEVCPSEDSESILCCNLPGAMCK